VQKSNHFQLNQLVDLAQQAAEAWEKNKPQRVPSRKTKRPERLDQAAEFDHKRKKQVATSYDLL